MIARLRLYSGLPCSLDIATARYRACSRCLLLTLHIGLVLCVGLLSVCHLVCHLRQSDDALPIGLPQSDYLAHHSIMFTSRPNAVHSAFRVAGFVRAGLTALPQIIQPPCDRLRSMQLADCVSFTSYQTSPSGLCITLLGLMQAKLCDSSVCPHTCQSAANKSSNQTYKHQTNFVSHFFSPSITAEH